jgi:hypothetical protein
MLAPARRSAARLGDQTGLAAFIEDGLSPGTRLLVKSTQAGLSETLACALNGRQAGFDGFGNLVIAQPIGGFEQDARSC